MRMWAMTEDGTPDSRVLAETALCDSCFTSENRAKAADGLGRSVAPYEFTIYNGDEGDACVNCGQRSRSDLEADGTEGAETAMRPVWGRTHKAGSSVGYW